MTEERDQGAKRGEGQKRGGPVGIGEGIRTGIGILNAFREAIEETISEASERGDFSADRARRAVHDATQRMQESFDEARERLDVVPRKEFDALQVEVAELRLRVEAIESRPPPPSPDDSGIIIDPG